MVGMVQLCHRATVSERNALNLFVCLHKAQVFETVKLSCDFLAMYICVLKIIVSV